MILEGRFEYKKALILTPDRVREFEIILLKYCKSISYEAETVADTNISFVSVDELLNYDNFQNRKIRSLAVTGRNGLERIVTCVFEASGLKFIKGYDDTCICRYTVRNVDTETILKEEIATFLKKITAEYWLMGKFRLFGLLGCACLYVIIPLMLLGRNNNNEINISAFIASMLLSYGLVTAIRLFDRHILEKLFPPIVFLWGEEKVRYEKCDSRRKNFFWGVIVAILVGIIVFYITNQLPK